VELTTRQEAEAELEALWSSVAQVQDLVLGGADRPSSLAMSMSAVVELLGNQIDVVAANRVRWRSRST
jgi:hypothetical protein